MRDLGEGGRAERVALRGAAKAASPSRAAAGAPIRRRTRPAAGDPGGGEAPCYYSRIF
jgi:hypothetical protein